MIWLVLGWLEASAEFTEASLSIYDEREQQVAQFRPSVHCVPMQRKTFEGQETRYAMELELAWPIEEEKQRLVHVELTLKNGATCAAPFKCGRFNRFAPAPPASWRIALQGSNGASVVTGGGVLVFLHWWHEAPTHGEPPPLVLRSMQDEDSDDEHPVALTLTTTSSHKVDNTIASGGGKRWFCQPGCYSGDDWVAAAALLVDPSLRGFLVTYKEGQVKTSQYLTKTAQALKFYKCCGVDDRIVTLYLDDVRQHEAVEHLEPCREFLKSHPQLGRPLDVGLVNITTSVLMRAIEQQGVQPVIKRLRKKFRAGLSPEAKKRVRARLKPLRALLEQQKKVVLVNMRITTYNVENIITEAIYEQLLRTARSYDCELVRVGIYQDDAAHKSNGRWTRLLAEPALDLYGVNEVGVRTVDMRETAYFWARIARWQAQVNGNLLGVVGGRSGSLDIAAFMGVRTLCYDTVNTHDWEYIRLFMTFPLMSIVARGGLPARPERSAKPDAIPELKEGTIVTHGLCAWMMGENVVPRHPDGSFFLPQYRHLMNVRNWPIDPREPYLGYLAYMRHWVDETYVDAGGWSYENEKNRWEPEGTTNVVVYDTIDEEVGPSEMVTEDPEQQSIRDRIATLRSDFLTAEYTVKPRIRDEIEDLEAQLKK